MAQWRQLTRDDLRAFDDYSTKAVLFAMEHGAQGRMSSNGHALLRAPNGATASVSRSTTRRQGRLKALAADLRRMFPEVDVDNLESPRQSAFAQSQLRKEAEASVALDGETQSVGVLSTTAEPTLECPAGWCDAVFVTEGARYAHVEKEHFKCTEPGCDFIARNVQGQTSHRRIVHEGIAPRRGTGRKQAAAAELAAKPVEKVTTKAENKPASKPRTVEPTKAVREAVQIVNDIRELLGEDPRVTELRQQVERLQGQLDDMARQRDDALTQLSLVREALHLNEPTRHKEPAA